MIPINQAKIVGLFPENDPVKIEFKDRKENYTVTKKYLDTIKSTDWSLASITAKVMGLAIPVILFLTTIIDLFAEYFFSKQQEEIELEENRANLKEPTNLIE